uniref:2-(3-amino-3-carboxypropyl)histidine synthase subunit 2 n=1 Tax=Anopheles farauti TaxID=69004 RepID=A0A182QA95_9DIPT
MSSVFSSSDTIAQNQIIDQSNVEQVALTDVWNDVQLTRCVHWIEQRALKRVALQFPDSVLPHSVHIVNELRDALSAGEDAAVQLFVLGDTSYGSCCVDEVAASHANADGIVHFGHACLSKVARVPVLYVFFQHALDETRLLTALASEYGTDGTDELELSCFYEVGYANAVARMSETLRARYPRMVIASLAEPDQQPDTLCWKFNEKPHAPHHPSLYIGRDNLSFFNTAVAIAATEWLRFDPTNEGEARLERTNAAGAQWLRRRYYAIERCKDAGSIGIVVATLSTSGYLSIVSRMQQLGKARGVRTYIISIGKVNPEKLANFIDIDCFVLVGCPENDIFTSRDFFRPLLSVYEAEMALNPAWAERLCTAGYTTNFADLLPDGRLYSDVEQVVAAMENGENVVAPDVSLVTGRARDGTRTRNALKRLEPDGSGMEVAVKGKNEVAQISSADHFASRSWQGLEQNLGQDAPARVQEGRSGLPIQYENDPTQCSD